MMHLMHGHVWHKWTYVVPPTTSVSMATNCQRFDLLNWPHRHQYPAYQYHTTTRPATTSQEQVYNCNVRPVHWVVVSTLKLAYYRRQQLKLKMSRTLIEVMNKTVCRAPRCTLRETICGVATEAFCSRGWAMILATSTLKMRTKSIRTDNDTSHWWL